MKLSLKKVVIFAACVLSYNHITPFIHPISLDQIPLEQQDCYTHFFNSGNASECDLSYLDLRYAIESLRERKGNSFRFSFAYADISRANLSRMNLVRTQFLRAKAIGAYFAQADLSYASFG